MAWSADFRSLASRPTMLANLEHSVTAELNVFLGSSGTASLGVTPSSARDGSHAVAHVDTRPAATPRLMSPSPSPAPRPKKVPIPSASASGRPRGSINSAALARSRSWSAAWLSRAAHQPNTAAPVAGRSSGRLDTDLFATFPPHSPRLVVPIEPPSSPRLTARARACARSHSSACDVSWLPVQSAPSDDDWDAFLASIGAGAAPTRQLFAQAHAWTAPRLLVQKRDGVPVTSGVAALASPSFAPHGETSGSRGVRGSFFSELAFEQAFLLASPRSR